MKIIASFDTTNVFTKSKCKTASRQAKEGIRSDGTNSN